MNEKEMKETLYVVVRCVYAFNAYYALRMLERFSMDTMPAFLLLLTFVCSGAGVLFVKRWWLRLLIMGISIVAYYFAIFSPIKTSHSYYFWLYVLMIFGISSFQDIQRTFYFAQLTILSTYTLTGLWKIAVALQQCTQQIISQCSFEGPAYIFATRSLQVAEFFPVGDFVIKTPLIAFVGFWSVTALQTTALILFLLFPRIRIAIALLFILFHIAVFVTMHITFFEEILLLFFIFVIPLTIHQSSHIGSSEYSSK